MCYIGCRERGKWRAYFVLLAAFLACMFNASLGYTAGVFHVALKEAYPADELIEVWLVSTHHSAFALAGPIASLVINWTSCRTCVVLSGLLGLVGMSTNFFISDIRWLFLTYALLAGVGTALAYTGSVVVLGFYFKKNLTVVTGIGICGAAMGVFVLPPVCQALISFYGLQGAFLITGAITFQSSLLGMVMKPSPLELEMKEKRFSGTTWQTANLRLLCCDFTSASKIFTNRHYIGLLISSLTFGMAISIPFVFIPDYLHEQGIEAGPASLSVSFSGIGSLVSRVLTGVAAHDRNIGCELMYIGINGLMSALMFLTPLFTSSSVAVFVYGFLVGLFTGGSWGLVYPITVNILGVQLMATGFGVVMFASGIGMVIGPPVAGSILRLFGNYYVVYIASGILFFLSSGSMLLSHKAEEPARTIAIKSQEELDIDGEADERTNMMTSVTDNKMF